MLVDQVAKLVQHLHALHGGRVRLKPGKASRAELHRLVHFGLGALRRPREQFAGAGIPDVKILSGLGQQTLAVDEKLERLDFFGGFHHAERKV